MSPKPARGWYDVLPRMGKKIYNVESFPDLYDDLASNPKLFADDASLLSW